MSKRIALITGAAGGIGHAIAVALAGAGFRIVINDIVSEADGNTIAGGRRARLGPSSQQNGKQKSAKAHRRMGKVCSR